MIHKIFDDMLNVSKEKFISGLICLEACIKTLQSIIYTGNFYRDYRERLAELGVRFLHSLLPEFDFANNSNPDFQAILQRYTLIIQSRHLQVLCLLYS